MFNKRPRCVVVSDLDHTMVAHNDPEHALLKEFNALWKDQLAGDSILIFSTGRSLEMYQKLREFAPALLHPDLLVCSVGTEIYEFAGGDAGDTSPGACKLNQEWLAHLSHGWDRARCLAVASAFPELVLQQESEQRPHKVSFTTEVGAERGMLLAAELGARLQAEGLRAKVVYSGGRDVDVLPEGAGKGQALAWLLGAMAQSVGAPTNGVLVCGDSGNDADLFKVPGVYGTVVSNAHDELRNFAAGEVAAGNDRILLASRPCAGGIVQALKQFRFVSS